MFFSFQIIWMTYSLQRGKPCVEKIPWFITGGGTAGSHRLGTSLSQVEVSWASMGWGGAVSGRFLTPSSRPAVGIIYCSPLNTCFLPETLESPTQDDFPFSSCLQPCFLLSPPREVLSIAACRNQTALSSHGQLQLKSLTLSATFSFCLLCSFFG